MSYVQSSDSQFWFKTNTSYTKLKECKVSITNILDDSFSDPMSSVSKCSVRNCKTCDILITDTSFTSNLTGQSFYTKTWENLNCKSSNVVYGIECNLCGLIYVGETKGSLNKRISGHRFQINHGGQQLLYKHFNSPDHSILSMNVRILEKIYHHTNSPSLSTLFRSNEKYFGLKN